MTGPPVILIPGMLCDEETWIDIAPALGAHSLPPLTRPTIAGMADEVLDTAPNTFVLAGLSLGAIVGFEILRRAPHRVTGFCAISTNASAPTPHQLSAWRSHAARTVAGDFETIVREDIAPTMFADARPSRAQVERFVEMARRVGPTTFRAQLAAQSTRSDALAHLTRVHRPTLVISASHDVLCPPRYHQRIADAIPGARLASVDAGHLCTWDRPDRLAQLIRSHLTDSPELQEI
ncbi:alpha/beta fold hydrolase [Gordonia sp. N1V]|uniref:alpha/beta fold hydrolase n=1 Tax=Gordonia sp. N1V TaxID=3034163 RepID=UPI0023E0FBF8|nr:alpha/beta fold hydrolase [Gordonia sp. N1V]MDF3283973.1 alpha/beta fold hydrolase [Gordonia sp. N1V]